MEEENKLINIAGYCSTIMIKHGLMIKQCTATFIREDDTIEFKVVYSLDGGKQKYTYIYSVPNYMFIMTDTEVLVNVTAIDNINTELEKRFNSILTN